MDFYTNMSQNGYVLKLCSYQIFIENLVFRSESWNKFLNKQWDFPSPTGKEGKITKFFYIWYEY